MNEMSMKPTVRKVVINKLNSLRAPKHTYYIMYKVCA